VPSDQLDALAAARPSMSVRLLPGFDQWVLGPGTDDERIVPRARRTAVSKTAGWIAPVVVVGGRVCGTWERTNGAVSVDWFAEAGKPPRARLQEEVRRLGRLTGASLSLTLRTAA
jgi:hypothetical protein